MKDKASLICCESNTCTPPMPYCDNGVPIGVPELVVNGPRKESYPGETYSKEDTCERSERPLIWKKTPKTRSQLKGSRSQSEERLQDAGNAV